MGTIRHDRTPIYFRVKSDIITRIQGHEWPPGQQIPTEPELQKMHGNVSRGTIRRALMELEMEGYIRRQQGKGTFVNRQTAHVPYHLGQIISFSQQVERAGLDPSTQILEKGLIPAHESDCQAQSAFGISASEQLIRIRRLRLGNGTPLAIQTTYLLPSRCPRILDNDLSSLFRLYERFGVHIVAASEVLTAAPPNREEGRLLQLLRRMHVIIRVRVSYDQSGDPFEVLRSVSPEDRFEFRYKIVHDESHIVQTIPETNHPHCQLEMRPVFDC